MSYARWALTAAIGVSAALVAPASAQIAEDAKAVLEESTLAIQNTPAYEFKVERSATNFLKDLIGASGVVRVLRQENQPPVILTDGKIKNPGSADLKVTLRYDGKNVEWLDFEKNTHFVRPVADVKAQQQLTAAEPVLLDQFRLAKPYERELGAEKLVKKGVENVNGEVCDVVEASFANGARVTTWAISVADRLPRRVEMGNGNDPAGRIAMITDLTDVKADIKLSPDDLAIKVPPGFVKDEPAPAPQSQLPNEPAQPPIEMGLTPGTPAPEFTVKDAAGKEVSLSSLKGKVAVLEFFGTKFAPATRHAAEVQTLVEQFPDARFVGLACREDSPSAPQEHFKSNNLTYTLVPQADELCDEFKVLGFPSYFVLSPEGKVAAFFQSFPGREPLSQAIQSAAAAD